MFRPVLYAFPVIVGLATAATQGTGQGPSAASDATPPAAGAQTTTQKTEIPGSTSATVLGREVKGADGAAVGRIINVLVDSAGKPRAAVIDFGGFMGVGSRHIAVAWTALHFPPGNAQAPVALDMTGDAIKAAPEYKGPGAAVTVVAPATRPGSSLLQPAQFASH